MKRIFLSLWSGRDWQRSRIVQILNVARVHLPVLHGRLRAIALNRPF